MFPNYRQAMTPNILDRLFDMVAEAVVVGNGP
jgi:hypothetical protein